MVAESRKEEQQNSLYSTMIASASAGMLARVFCHPLDTAKAKLQAQYNMNSSSSIYYRNAIDVLKRTWYTEGIRGWYRGFNVTILGSAPGTMLYLTSYEQSKAFLTTNFEPIPNFALHFSSGMLAESISCIFWVPIDVIKERLQVQKTGTASSYHNTRHAITSILRKEGLRGIYRGYSATLTSFGPFSAMYFLFYEQLKHTSAIIANTNPPPFWMILSSSALAGALASLCTNPLDLVKLRLQIQRQNNTNTEAYTGVLDGLQKTVRSEGVRGLFKGAGARMAFHAPSTALTIALFEHFKATLH